MRGHTVRGIQCHTHCLTYTVRYTVYVTLVKGAAYETG